VPPTVVAVPVQGIPGTRFHVVIGDFPANTPIAITAGKKGAQKATIETGQVDANGNLDAQVAMPIADNSNEEWVVVVNATDGSGISVESNPFKVTNVDEPEWGNVVSYIVKPGDALSSLAARFDTSVPEILEDNSKITNPNQIYVGERLSIPVGNHM